MYKNIIFDIGGVMVEWKPLNYLLERFTRAETEETVYNLTFGSKEWLMLDCSSLTRYEANKIMLENAKKAGCVFEVQEVIDDWTSILHPRHRVMELALRLKKHGYHIYYLSNIAADTLSMLKERDFGNLFDGGVASCDIHIAKPDPRIYQALLEKYSLRADECVFIDDMVPNVQAACDLGITGIPLTGSTNALMRNLNNCGIRVK